MTPVTVRGFQLAHSLTADGIVGPRTRAVIEAEQAMMRHVPVLPYLGQDARVSCPYGDMRASGPHQGEDWMFGGRHHWSFPAEALICAAAAGVVVYRAHARNGWRLWIQHATRQRTAYLHLAEPLVQIGDAVEFGQPIAHATQLMTEADPPHLHFAVAPLGTLRWLDPEVWRRTAQWIDTLSPS